MRPRRKGIGDRVFLGPHGQISQYAIRQFEVAFQFFDGAPRRVIPEQGVEALALFLDPIGKIAHAPFIDQGHGALLSLDHLFEPFDKLFIPRSPLRVNHE